MPVQESEMIDLDHVIGVYPICNTGIVLLHKIAQFFLFFLKTVPLLLHLVR